MERPERVRGLTAAGSGIGRAVALELASRGRPLALSGDDPDGNRRLERIESTT